MAWPRVKAGIPGESGKDLTYGSGGGSKGKRNVSRGIELVEWEWGGAGELWLNSP